MISQKLLKKQKRLRKWQIRTLEVQKNQLIANTNQRKMILTMITVVRKIFYTGARNPPRETNTQKRKTRRRAALKGYQPMAGKYAKFNQTV